MLADLPPPEPAAITRVQQADLDCLSFALAIPKLGGAAEPYSAKTRMVRIVLGRLRQSDPSRDWLKLTSPVPSDMLYGDFMGRMNECGHRANPRYRRR